MLCVEMLAIVRRIDAQQSQGIERDQHRGPGIGQDGDPEPGQPQHGRR